MKLDAQEISILQTVEKLSNFGRVCNNIWQLHFPPIDQSVCQFPHTALTQHQYMKVKVESATSNK